MDGECAFCGRADAGTYAVFCQDCRAQHGVCERCLAEATPEAATLGLEMLFQPAPAAAVPIAILRSRQADVAQG
jgi:hypothetical protein